MTGAVPDETFNAFVDQRLSPKTERGVRLRLEADPQALARALAWQRHSEALGSVFAPIAHEPLPLSILLKLQASQPAWRPDPVLLRTVTVFCLGLVCGLVLAWLAYRHIPL